jgi:hypothetical protein
MSLANCARHGPERTGVNEDTVALPLQLVRKLSGAPASTEQKQRLTKVIAAENDILLEFPENTGDTDQVGCNLRYLAM